MAVIKFQKAKPMQAFYKGTVYGESGSGKSWTSLLQAEGLAGLTGKRIAYVDTEHGTDFYTERFDYDRICTKSLADTLDSIQALNPKTHSVIIIDSISHLWDSAISAFEGKRTRNESANGIPMHAWGGIKKPYKNLIRWLMDCEFHVFIIGRQKNIFEDDENGNMKKIGVGLRAETETQYEPHICCRMVAKKSDNDTTKSTHYALYEKDRTGLLSGRTFPNPSFKTIECIVPLLSAKTQAKSEDPDDVIAKDSELLDKEEEAKEKKSAEILQACKELVAKTKDLKALADVTEQCKTKKRYMNKRDETLLRAELTARQQHHLKLAS